MTNVTIPNDELMACADGTLPVERANAIRAQAAQDANLARRLATFEAEADALRRVFAPVLSEPVPDRLRQLFAEPAPKPRGWFAAAAEWLTGQGALPAGLAAAVVVGVLVTTLVPRTEQAGPSGSSADPLAAAASDPMLLASLGALPSGTPGPATRDGRALELLPLSTVQVADGRHCREFELGDAEASGKGFACRGTGGEWQLVAFQPTVAEAEAEAATAAGGFVPAGGGELALPAISHRLTPAEEAELLAGWR